jgi:two-component system nitrogen regulation response regulator GlnG
VDVRIVAATNRDLEAMTGEGRFREDLLFRLNGVTLTLPPLKDRKGDIEVLAGHFLERFTGEFETGPKKLSDKALKEMERYHWPGNVRELENVLRRAVLLSPGVVIAPDDLGLPETRTKRESLEEIITAKLKPVIDRTDNSVKHDLYTFIMPFMERPLIRLVLEKTRGNQVKAAEILGINRNTLRKKIKELDIDLGKTR